MTYFAPTTHITPLATLRRERLLPDPGEVVVQPNQRVEASDIVARAFVAKEHRVVDYAHLLGLLPAKADALLLKHDGDQVHKGEPLALRQGVLGLGRRRVLSPVDGMVLVVGDGKALLAGFDAPFELRAGMPGVIVGVREERGVTIETVGALLEGVWGNGGNDFAVMRVLGPGPQDSLTADSIDVSLRGAILAVGTLRDQAALAKVAEMNIRGLILGSLPVDLLPAVQALSQPVLLTDGFGGQGFSAPVHALLSGNDGREVSLNARQWDRFAGARPEVIVFLPTPGQAPPPLAEGEALAPGKRVRVVRGPDTGTAGTVSAISERALVTASGVRSRVATVALDAPPGTAVSVPFANLEILE